MDYGWMDKYVGLPWKIGGRDFPALDCWGLVRLVLARERGILLPSWAEEEGALSPRREERSRALMRHAHEFDPVPRGEERMFDIATLFRDGALWHVGIWVGPECVVLHTEDEQGSLGADWTRRPGFRREYGGCCRARAR